ncbi:MAG: RluA family pseudouridine synthase, partial [Clostridia bacterium]|nr:RluA family pseudouridine synthase [Clostridia bacterium]
MSDLLFFKVPQELDNERIDKAMVIHIDSISRSSVQKLIEQNAITVNGKKVNKKYKVKTGDEIEVNVPEPQELNVLAQDIPLDIRFDDDDLLVVNKAKGMVVHPAAGNLDNTLVNALLFHCKGSLSGINGVIRPGIVHRIDKDTSGLLIVAKNDIAHVGLANQIKEHSFTREYRAIVHGNLKQDKGTIDAPIGRNKNDRKKMAVTKEHSKNAVTHYEVLERYNGFTYIKVRLETGRTHQIRVHMAYIGHPVAGDKV